MLLINGLRALANPTRLRVLEMLRDASKFEGPHLVIDGREVGVTAKALLKRLKCKQPSLHEHMKVLIHHGLVEARPMGRWVVYTRDEERIRQLRQIIIDQLLPPAADTSSER
jgi:ArsR family transcriptional regulator